MTDIMKLHDAAVAAALDTAARSLGDHDQKTRAALQEAIEALQAECAEHKENAMRNARIAVSIWAERDALQAKLDAMGKGEPVTQGDPVPLYRAAINCPHEAVTAINALKEPTP